MLPTPDGLLPTFHGNSLTERYSLHVSRARPAFPQPECPSVILRQRTVIFPSSSFLKTLEATGLSTFMGLISRDSYPPSRLTRAQASARWRGGCRPLGKMIPLGNSSQGTRRSGGLGSVQGTDREGNSSNSDKDFCSSPSSCLTPRTRPRCKKVSDDDALGLGWCGAVTGASQVCAADRSGVTPLPPLTHGKHVN